MLNRGFFGLAIGSQVLLQFLLCPRDGVWSAVTLRTASCHSHDFEPIAPRDHPATVRTAGQGVPKFVPKHESDP
jgi:hypothetical protein